MKPNSTSAKFVENAADGSGRNPEICPTFWGYVIRSDQAGTGARALLGIAGKFLGVILIMAAAGLWLMPDALNGADVMAMKIAASVMFLIIGGALVWTARDDSQTEIQVDLIRSELRRGQRSRRGDFRLSTLLDFDDVGSVFLARAEQPADPARLFVRLGDSDRALEIAHGAEAGLAELKDRLIADLTAARDPKRAARRAGRLPKLASPLAA